MTRKREGFHYIHGRENDLGITYSHGLGCRRHPNCFTCPEKYCRFSPSNTDDRKSLQDRGNGIKVW